MMIGDSFTIENKYNLPDGNYVGIWPHEQDIKVMIRETFKVEGDPRTHRRTVDTGVIIYGDDWAQFRSGIMSRYWGMFGTEIVVRGNEIEISG